MEFLSSLEDVKQTIIENTEFIRSLENCCDDNFRENVQKLLNEKMKDRLKIGEDIIALKAKHKRIDAALQNVLNEAETVEEANAKCAEILENEERKRTNIKQSAEYKEFKQRLTAVGGDSNATNVNDEEVTEVVEPGGKVVSMFDPWSKKLMLNPVRNTKCGHHYEKDSVDAMLQGNSGIRCPVVGCPIKSCISLKHLEPDIALREKIRAYKAQQELAESLSEEEDG
ncbi:PREDICTED: E3 SUMO-protein ligase NSE2 [Drosophila arizonae]|uniref:E3 SUMO-protein ligase NSE2 n=1 Tax=Drosophila arizonae TaxID=7263 RepID=A0ABM1PY19_DROAR|nr:PREDICTED: E3 SUMO-protein ligase NSE2 [Drosophila arizonae]